MKFFSVVVSLILAAGTTTTGYAGAMLLHKNAAAWLPVRLIENAADTIPAQAPLSVKPYAVVKGDIALLKCTVTNAGVSTTTDWQPAAGNPAPSAISKEANGEATVVIPKANGNYFYNLLVISGGDTSHYQTYINRNDNKLKAYDIATDNVTWLSDAVIYEITPNNFVRKGTYDDITKKLPEIANLGVNTIWLQPVMKSAHGGQAYDVIDYMALRTDMGTEGQLANLIKAAKGLGMRVIFDFVPNHTAIEHPYAQDIIKKGSKSRYYNLYQHKNDGAPYSKFYHTDKNGFVSYFWESLVNLDYNNPKVQEWIITACKYWINKFDIDGYRFDAVWGVRSRTPGFTNRLRTELKSIKPDLLLLAEDKASDKTVYTAGFDAAYDWTADTAWVSQWSWQTHHDAKKSLTIFNSPDTAKRAALLSRQLFSQTGKSARVLRFLENNDVPRFIASHTLAQTKSAAALMFAQPGIPMLYNGQEAGRLTHPYSPKTIFSADSTIAQTDKNGLYDYYKHLIALRKQYPALRSTIVNQVKIANTSSVVAMQRCWGADSIIVLTNLNSAPAKPRLYLLYAQVSAQQGQTKAIDLLTNKTIDCKTQNDQGFDVELDGYETKYLLLTSK